MKNGAFGIIFDDSNRVLISLRNDYDLWNLPGGGIEEGESPWDAVIREVKEETGLDVEIVRLSGVYYKTANSWFGFAFVCKIVGGELVLTDEAKEHGYFSYDDLPKNFSPHQKERILDALQNTMGLKTQDGPTTLDLLKQGILKSSN